ncbi:hypothetical protein RV420_400258 [Roseovarius sp. EC-SD190]|nr:hypothetical protein RV420_400258 [Roseovarius sp. EC-SD190]
MSQMRPRSSRLTGARAEATRGYEHRPLYYLLHLHLSFLGRAGLVFPSDHEVAKPAAGPRARTR